MRTTRSTEHKRKVEEGIVEEPKPKRMTLGKHLALIRQEEEEQLLENENIARYEQFTNYEKDTIVADLSATEINGALFRDHNFYSAGAPHNAKILFLTLQTGAHPKKFTHFCNNSSLCWNLEHLHVRSSEYHFGIPSVLMVFVRGAHVEGTSLTADTYKFLGLVGLQSVSSDGVNGIYEYKTGRLIFDYNLSRKELELFGDNVLKCKKNKYGCSLCV